MLNKIIIKKLKKGLLNKMKIVFTYEYKYGNMPSEFDTGIDLTNKAVTLIHTFGFSSSYIDILGDDRFQIIDGTKIRPMVFPQVGSIFRVVASDLAPVPINVDVKELRRKFSTVPNCVASTYCLGVNANDTNVSGDLKSFVVKERFYDSLVSSGMITMHLAYVPSGPGNVEIGVENNLDVEFFKTSIPVLNSEIGQKVTKLITFPFTGDLPQHFQVFANFKGDLVEKAIYFCEKDDAPIFRHYTLHELGHRLIYY